MTRPTFIPPEIPPPSQARATADSIKRAIPAFHPLAWEELMRLTPSIAGPMHEMRPAVWGWGV